jgi:hypothetical protein
MACKSNAFVGCQGWWKFSKTFSISHDFSRCLSVKYELSYESMGFFLVDERGKRKGFLCLSCSEFGIRFFTHSN